MADATEDNPVGSSGVGVGGGGGEDFPDDFKKYMLRELDWSRLNKDGISGADSDSSEAIGWVFWSRHHDDDDESRLPSYGTLDAPSTRKLIKRALGKIIVHPGFGPSLVQFWAATTTLEGRTLLTAQNQPFAFATVDNGLCQYRMISEEYRFYAHGEGKEEGEELGIPGRVFLHKYPESTPNVEYYSVKEYPQRDHALHCQVESSWALPVFEHSSRICVGVLELVSTADAMIDWYDKSFLIHLYDVFQELGLQCMEVYKHCEMQYKDEDKAHTVAFHEIAMVLESVCKIHKLPLALTWVPCSACNDLLRGQLSSGGVEYVEVNNDDLIDLVRASNGHHLRKGQGVAGRALLSPKLLYCLDVTQSSITEYPLVHYARQCGLSGCFTVCLLSSYTGNKVYVLEFFLPANSVDGDNTLAALIKTLGTMKKFSRTLKLASGKELGEEISMEVIDFPERQELHSIRASQTTRFSPSLVPLQNGGVTIQIDSSDHPSMDAINNGMNVISAERNNIVVNGSEEEGTRKAQKRGQERTGVRIEIPLEDILECSNMSRDVAARKLQVSVTTFRRICREHGIPRWPPRNIYKPSPPRPSHVDHQEEIPHLNSVPPSNQASASVARASSHDSVMQATRSLPGRVSRTQISIEDMLKCSEMNRTDAARELGVSISTFKRVCRQFGMDRWPPRNVSNDDRPRPSHVDHQKEIPQLNSDLPSDLTGNSFASAAEGLLEVEVSGGSGYWTTSKSSDPSPSQPTSTITHMMPHLTARQDVRYVTLKATYGDLIMRFQLPLTSGIVELKGEVSKRLGLELDSFIIEYQDDDREWILISCDDDYRACLQFSSSLGNQVIRLLVLDKAAKATNLCESCRALKRKRP